MEPLAQAVGGLVGAWYATSVTFPLDVVKTRITSQSSAKAKYTGILHALRTIAAEEGVLALYAGLQGQFVQTSIGNFSYFYLYEVIKSAALTGKKKLLGKSGSKRSRRAVSAPHVTHVTGTPSTAVVTPMQEEAGDGIELNVVENLVVGVVAGIIQQLLITPLNVALVRIKTKRKPAQDSSSLFVVLTRLLQQEGFFALYSGIVPSLVLTSNPAIQFMVFDKLKTWWLPSAPPAPAAKRSRKQSRLLPQTVHNATPISLKPGKNQKVAKQEKMSSGATFVMGAIAKIVATLVTYPYVMARVRMQASSKKKTTFSVLTKVLRKDGFFGLYSGLRAQLLKSVLFAALLFMVKEKISAYTSALLIR